MTKTTTNKSPLKINRTMSSTMLKEDELASLSELLMEDLDNILLYFEVDKVKRTQLKLYGACPIHKGDQEKSPFNMYLIGDYYRGNWKCRSHNCHEIFKPSLLGFIRGLISQKKYGWNNHGDKIASFSETIAWCLQWTKQTQESLIGDKSDLEKIRFINLSRTKLIQKPPEMKFSRDAIRQHLSFPAKQFIDRGFSEDLLDKYDIGVSKNKDPVSEMFERVVVPIYDETHSYMVGCSGRSIHPCCTNCRLYHSSNSSCPNDYIFQYVKWRHSKMLKAEENLFNYWFAKKAIQNCSTAIITESVGNVLRLESAGIRIGVATFGDHLTESQQLLLSKLGVMRIIIIADIDENNAGINSANLIKQQYSRLFNINIVSKLPNGKSDLAEMTNEETKDLINPLLQKFGVN